MYSGHQISRFETSATNKMMIFKKTGRDKPGPVQQGGNANARVASSRGVMIELCAGNEAFKIDSAILVQIRYAPIA